MKRSSLAAICSALLLLLVLSACGESTTGTTTKLSGGSPTMMPGMNMDTPTPIVGSDPMTDSLKGLSGKDFDVKFMQEMIVHHQSAIDMAQLVSTHTKRAELITLAQNIITAQSKEITTMTTWLSQWYHEKPLTDSMSAPGMMNMMGDMDTLKNAKDADFDKQFLTMMIAHHQQAVNMANLIPSRTQHQELVQLGQDIVKAQSAEIQQMKGWQQQWFQS